MVEVDAPRRFVEAYLGRGMAADWPFPCDDDWRQLQPRWSLTPGSGMEASLSSGADRDPMTLRYALELGADQRDMAGRLDVQRRAAGRLARALTGPSASEVSSAIEAALDMCFPPDALRAPGPSFTTWLGVEHHPDDPGRLTTLKLYGNLRWDSEAPGRLATHDAVFARLLRAIPAGAAAPAFFAVGYGPGCERVAKLYLTPERGAGHQCLVAASSAAGLPAGDVVRHVQAAGIEPCLWGRWTKLCLSSTGDRPSLTVHAATAGLAPASSGAVVDRFVAAAGLEGAAERAREAGAAAGWPWEPTVLAVGIGSRGVTKRTLYFAPPVPQQVRAAAAHR